MRQLMRAHGPAIAIICALTVILSYPTITYVFRFDVFWLPEGGNRDILTNLWNSWYFGQILAGKADLLYADLIFYPEGVSLVYSYVSIPYSLAMNLLGIVMPPSNAFCVVFLLILASNALAAYVYLHWLFKDRWLALFGAAVFGFCPMAIGYTAWPALNWIAPMPLAFYLFHRGMNEKRGGLVALAGICAGLTCVVIMYFYVCVVISLGLFVCALAVKRWRERDFWRLIGILALTLTLASAWRVLPMLLDSAALDRAADIAQMELNLQDVLSFFINEQNPFLGKLVTSLGQIPENKAIGGKSYLGLLPLALVAIGLLSKSSRRQMLPWLGLLLVFLALRLESTLVVNGAVFESVKLPKHYLNQLLPFLFSAFTRAKFFMAGAWLPWAVLACFGLLALRRRLPYVTKPAAILLMIAFVCMEYYIPVDRAGQPWGPEVAPHRADFLDWLADAGGEVRLVNLPMRSNAIKVYSYYQTLSGFPIIEGATSRTPDRAYDYIRGNYVLGAWNSHKPIHCDFADREAYLAAVDAMESDGFSHIVLHRDLFDAASVEESFYGIPPSYYDAFVSIYTPQDLRQSCPQAREARHSFAESHARALSANPDIGARPGLAVFLPPTPEFGEHFLRHLRLHGQDDSAVAAIVSPAPGQVEFLNAEQRDLESQNALWLLRDLDAEQAQPAPANAAWLMQRFKPCASVYHDERVAIELLVKHAIPCAAAEPSSAMDINYADSIALRSAHSQLDGEQLNLYLAWSVRSRTTYAFSFQLFAEDGHKALQYDNIIEPQLLSHHAVDAASLPAGQYAAQLIVYDYETQASLGGINTDSGESFERALDLGMHTVD